jgi:L-iditol 2-dehydrogenase
MRKTMKALVVEAPGNYAIQTVPVPEVPAGGMRIRVLACALCGSDLRTLRSGHRRVTLPWIIGHEVCGVVEDVGSSYQGPWKVGETLAVGPVIYCGKCEFCLTGRYELCIDYREIAQAWPGGFAEYMAVPEESVRLGTIQRVPAGVDPAHAAITEPIASCVHAHIKGQTGMGDTVMIIGSGPVGCIHAVLARIRGAEKIIIADISDERLKLAQAFAPDEVLNAAKIDLVSEVRRLTGGYGPDAVICATPAPAAVVQAVEMCKKGGRVLLFAGLPKDDSKPGVDMNTVHYNGLYLIGTTTFAPRHQMLAMRLVASGRMPVEKIISHRFPLADFVEGATMALEGRVLKAVFLP